MRTTTVTTNMDKPCEECGKGGALASGICLACVNKAMKPGAQMKSAEGKLLHQRWKNLKKMKRS